MRKNSQEKIVQIAEQFAQKQRRMLQNIEHLTEFLARQHSADDALTAACPQLNAKINTLYNNVANIGVVDTSGNLICDLTNNDTNINISDRHYFQNAVKNKSFAIGYFQIDRSIQKYTVNFAYPILNTQNQVKGVLVTVIALDSWNQAFNKITLPDRSFAYITDDQQRILASYPNDSEKIGQLLQNADLAHSQQINSIVKDSNGISRFFHYKTLYLDEHNNKLGFYLSLPINDILSQAKVNIYKTIMFIFIFALLFILLARRLINQSLLLPLTNLSEATLKLANGVMPDEVKHNSPELNLLYQRFKYMAETRLTAESKLKNQHAELNSLLTALPDTYLRIDTQGNILTIHGHLLSVNDEKTRTSHLATLFSEHNSQLILAHLPNANQVSQTEFKSCQNTAWQTYEARIIAMQKEHEFMVIIRDISQRKESEEALNLAAIAYQNSSEGMIITDQNGIISDVNPAFCSSTLYSKREVIGRSVSLLGSGKHSDEFYQDMWYSLNTTGRWQGEIINRKKDGTLFNELLTIDTVYDNDQNPIRRIAIFTDLTEKKQADELIWRQAHYDHLTDLPNRLELKERLQNHFPALKNTHKQLVIMLLDVDNFKDINDTLGHHYGDNLLKIVSKRIIASAKEAAFVARIGGDEFVVVFDEIDNENKSKEIAANILNSFSTPIELEGEKLYISVSIGIACAPTDGENTEQLLKAADQAMYQAKSNGRNGFEFFSADMRIEAQARMHLLKDLRVAIERQQFELYYQPIVTLSDLTIHKAEGLIRWHHPEKGVISPATFIPLTEETRQINALGQFVFNQAIATLSAPDLPAQFQISINVSPIQLATLDSGIDQWQSQLREAGLPPSAIVAEITEGLMVNPEALTQRRLKALVNSGMQLALDDFGTGYSSLAYLQEMDTDYLKIDKRFVDHIVPGSQELALCEAIIVMAHQLGLQVIAEGIETQQQMELLLNAGCDYGQGYLFAKPMPKADFLQLVCNTTEI